MQYRRTIPLLSLALWCVLGAHAALAAPADDQYALAAGQYAQGRWELAIVEFEAFLVRHPNHPQVPTARFYLGEALVQADRPDEAVEHFTRFLSEVGEHPQRGRAEFRVAELAMLQGNLQRASASFEAFLDHSAESDLAPFALAYWGDILLRQGDAHRASRHLQAAIDSLPSGPLSEQSRFLLAQAYQAQGENNQAIRLLTEVAESSSPRADRAQLELGLLHYNEQQNALCCEVLGQFESQFAGSSLTSEARYWHGLARLRSGQAAEAGELFERALREGAITTFTGDLAFFAAQSHRQSGQTELAITRYLQLIEELPDHPRAPGSWIALIEIALAQGDLEGAEQRLVAAIEQSQVSEQIEAKRLQIARSWLESHEYDRAIAILGEPTDSQAEHAFLVALAHLGASRPEQAFEVLQQVEGNELSGELEGAIAATRGSALLELQRYREAVEPLSWYVQASPEGPDAAKCRADLVVAFAHLEAFDLAEEQLNQLRLAHPDHPLVTPTQLFLAGKQLEREELDSATELLSDLPADDTTLYRWAWRLRNRGEHAEAEELFQRLVETFPTSPYWTDSTYRLAEQASSRDEHTRAAELLEQIISRGDQSDVLPFALYLQGQTAASLEQWDLVDQACGQLLQGYPQHTLEIAARYWHAESAFRTDDFTSATTRYEELATLVADRSDAWLAIVPLRRAQLKVHQQNWEDGLELASSVALRFPGAPETVQADYLMGRCLAAKGRFQEAREAYQRVVDAPAGRQSETAAKAQWMIGESYFHQQSWLEAIRAYGRVEHLYDYPQWQSAAMLQSGKCYQRLDRLDQARTMYQAVVNDYAETEYVAAAQQQLETLGGETIDSRIE